MFILDNHYQFDFVIAVGAIFDTILVCFWSYSHQRDHFDAAAIAKAQRENWAELNEDVDNTT